MRSRSLGIVFVAAVIAPSILLAVLSIRSAGREEAWMEKQVATTLDAEVAHAAGLASAEVSRITDDLRSGLEVPSGSDYARALTKWKSATPLVAVPFLLSPRYGILWPPADHRADAEQKQFLKEHGSFLADQAATEVLQNIAVRYQAQILADKEQAPPPAAPSPAEQPSAAAAGPVSAARRAAIDTFAQSPDVQNRVYEEAREKGDLLNQRVVAPKVSLPEAQSYADAAVSASAAEGEQPAGSATGGSVRAETAPSRYVITSQLLSQIASRGDHGVIPRFVGQRLQFLFWDRQKDGRIAGCRVADAAFRSRIAGVLESTWTPVRILTLLDENGAPLAVAPDSAGRDWRRPFVAREVGESLPRWEAAAYLTRPDVIAARARSSSLVIWIMVMVLFVSVVGGGVMVLSSVQAEARLAQQKATFVTNVSHELRTPLTSISLFVELLRRKGPLPAAKRAQYLSLMASETERLTRLISNVLDFSRDTNARRYEMRTVEAGEVARQIVESQRVRLEARGFSLCFESSGDTTVRADAEALKQLLLNLLSNAEKYSRDTREIAVWVTRDGEDVRMTVADRGIGVPQKEREKIFREFYRVNDSLSSGVQGTGLGLSIARRIARDHGGDVTCAARSGGGSEFAVRLPAAPAAEEEA